MIIVCLLRLTITTFSSIIQCKPITIGPPIATMVHFGCKTEPVPIVIAPLSVTSWGIMTFEPILKSSFLYSGDWRNQQTDMFDKVSHNPAHASPTFDIEILTR